MIPIVSLISSRLTGRGLGQDEIGVLPEGAPQNDIGCYHAYPSRFADTETPKQIALAAAAVDIATYRGNTARKACKIS